VALREFVFALGPLERNDAVANLVSDVISTRVRPTPVPEE
jgi:hypothetical protein